MFLNFVQFEHSSHEVGRTVVSSGLNNQNFVFGVTELCAAA